MIRLLAMLAPLGVALVILPSGRVSAAPDEGMSVQRLQIAFTTDNIRDAGTDDDVFVSVTAGETTWIDTPKDDFERGADYRYDLTLDGIETVRDIQFLTIGKTGSDGWCLESFGLVLNEKTVFSLDLRRGLGVDRSGRWFDNSEGHSLSLTYSGQTLRSAQPWLRYEPRTIGLPYTIPKQTFESRIVAIVGDRLYGTEAYWVPPGIRISRKSATALHVDLDLAARVPGGVDPGINVEFDLLFACTGGRITVTSTPPDVSASFGFTHVVSFFPLAASLLAEQISDEVAGRIQPMTETLAEEAICLSVNVSSKADVTISFPGG